MDVRTSQSCIIGTHPVQAGLPRDIRIHPRYPRPVAPPMSLLPHKRGGTRRASSFAFIRRLDHRLRSIDISWLDCGLHPRFHGNFPIMPHFTSDRTVTESMFTALHLLGFNVDRTKDPIWYHLMGCRTAFQNSQFITDIWNRNPIQRR